MMRSHVTSAIVAALLVLGVDAAAKKASKSESKVAADGEGSKNEEPWFVAESSCDLHDYYAEQQDEEERLETASIQHQVHLWMCIERESNQQIGQQHAEE